MKNQNSIKNLKDHLKGHYLYDWYDLPNQNSIDETNIKIRFNKKFIYIKLGNTKINLMKFKDITNYIIDEEGFISIDGLNLMDIQYDGILLEKL